MRKTIGIIILVLFTSVVTLFYQRCTNNEPPITKEALGKLIFFDNSLSEPYGQSCATCHRPERGFTDTLGRDVSEGAFSGLFSKRNSMSIAYTTYIPPLSYVSKDGDSLYIGGLFWDGRADSLAHQAGMPFLDKLEMGNENEEMVVKKVMKAPYYPEFCKIYGKTDVQGLQKQEVIKRIYGQIVNALAAYQASEEINQYSSRFDAYLDGKYQMNQQEAKGFELFQGKGLCSQCHILEADPAANKVLFTDHTYDNLGIPKNPNNPFYNQDSIHNPHNINYIDIGLMATTGREADLGMFRVPTLRNIEKTAPYGHNGYFVSLEDIVHFYNVRDISDEYPAAECPATVNRTELGNLGLTPHEERCLIEFMKMLSDETKN